MIVGRGQSLGGDFRHIPACRSAGRTDAWSPTRPSTSPRPRMPCSAVPTTCWSGARTLEAGGPGRQPGGAHPRARCAAALLSDGALPRPTRAGCRSAASGSHALGHDAEPVPRPLREWRGRHVASDRRYRRPRGNPPLRYPGDRPGLGAAPRGRAHRLRQPGGPRQAQGCCLPGSAPREGAFDEHGNGQSTALSMELCGASKKGRRARARSSLRRDGGGRHRACAARGAWFRRGTSGTGVGGRSPPPPRGGEPHRNGARPRFSSRRRGCGRVGPGGVRVAGDEVVDGTASCPSVSGNRLAHSGLPPSGSRSRTTSRTGWSPRSWPSCACPTAGLTSFRWPFHAHRTEEAAGSDRALGRPACLVDRVRCWRAGHCSLASRRLRPRPIGEHRRCRKRSREHSVHSVLEQVGESYEQRAIALGAANEYLRQLAPLHNRWHGFSRGARPIGFLLFHWHVIEHFRAAGLERSWVATVPTRRPTSALAVPLRMPSGRPGWAASPTRAICRGWPTSGWRSSAGTTLSATWWSAW